MNNQIELTIIPENASEDYDLNAICETAESVYWTLELPYEINYSQYKQFSTDFNK